MRKKIVRCARCDGPIPGEKPLTGGSGKPRLDGTRSSRPVRHFCSKECYAAQNAEDHRRLVDRVKDWVFCIWCHELHPPRSPSNRRFCSPRCGAAFHRAQHQRRLEVGRDIEEGRR